MCDVSNVGSLRNLKYQTDLSTNRVKQENMPFEIPSSCSCPQCNSVECFKIRNENANLLCTCHSCKDTCSIKTFPSKKSSDRCNHEGIIKIDEDYGKASLKVNSNSDMPKRKSVKVCDLEDNETVVREEVQKNDPMTRIIDKECEQTDSYNIKTKRKHSEDQSYYNMTKKVVQIDEQKRTVNTKRVLDCKKNDDIGFHDKIKDQQNENNKKDDELKDLPQTYSNKDSDEKHDVKNCYEKSKKDLKNQDPTGIVKTHIKSDLSNIKLTTKSGCEKGMQSHGKRNDKEKCDEINYRELTKKNIEEQIKSNTSEVKLHECTKLRYKDKTLIKDKIRKSESSYEKSYTRNYSVAMTYTRNAENTEFENPAATLSAQIMNLPCQDFKDSLSSERNACSLNTNKVVTKQDIFTRLKEVYKACSCKVCECIATFSGNGVLNDTCGYEDSEQTNTHNTHCDSRQTLRNCNQLPPSGCPCYRCDRKDCRGVWKNKMDTASCDCKPCDCVKITKSFTKPCDCEPCQCAECTHLNFHIPQKFVVAPMQGNFQHNLCRCEPCECVQCTHNYGAMASSLMREASTGMVSHRNCNCESCVSNSCQFDSIDCRCDTQNRIMRKPIDRSVRDYDLRQAVIGESSFSQKYYDKFKNCDTIAMFAFPNTYPNKECNAIEDNCHCINCECITCKDKEVCENKIKKFYEDLALVLPNLSDQSLADCKCQSCECQTCCNNRDAKCNVIETFSAVNNCGCDICDCLACKRLHYCSQGRDSRLVDDSIQYSEDFSDNISKESIHPVRKGKLLTPNMFEAKMLSHDQSQVHIKKKTLPITSMSNKHNKKLLCLEKKPFRSKLNNINNSYSNDSTLQSTNYFNKSNIDTVQINVDCTVIKNDTIRLHSNGNKLINNNVASSTNFIYPYNSSKDRTENYMHEEIINHNQRHMDANNNEVALFNENLNSIVQETSKVNINSNADLFCSKIFSFEKSISQLQEDISQNLKALKDIRSICKLSPGNFTRNNAEFVFPDIITQKPCSNMQELDEINPVQFMKIHEEPVKIQKPLTIENNKILVNGTYNSCDYIKLNQNDNFSKGDNKMYTKHMKKCRGNVYKLKKHGARSKIKKLSINSENKISNCISDHLKGNYRHHSKNKRHNFNFTSAESVSTAYENCLIPRILKFNDKDNHSKTDIQQDDAKTALLKKSLSINFDKAVTNMGVCTIPELELNIKRAVQSVSLQTNDTRGYAALAKLHNEVSKLLNSPMLQVGCIQNFLKYDIDAMKEDNITFEPNSKSDWQSKNVFSTVASQTQRQKLFVDKEINCNVGQPTNNDMKKLMDCLLTHTVCKSELAKPVNSMPETLPTSPKITTVKTRCEDLKASFMGLRRVSDHTVLVRWRVPRELDNVQGYELQVDGRAVQKILSPTRCMAILTCLPNCEKLLLTIRTLTSTVLPLDHNPAATVVYYPREKRSLGRNLSSIKELRKT